MSLGSFFSSNWPVHKSVLPVLTGPDKICLRDQLLVGDSHILLTGLYPKLAAPLVQAALNDLPDSRALDVFYLDVAQCLAISQSAAEIGELFGELMDDLGQSNKHLWVYVEQLDDLMLHQTPAAMALMQELQQFASLNQCGLIYTLRDINNLALFKQHYALFCANGVVMQFGQPSDKEIDALFENDIYQLQREKNFHFDVKHIPQLREVVSRYFARTQLSERLFGLAKIALARMGALQVARHDQPELTLQILLEVLSDWQQIPVRHLFHDAHYLDALPDFLKQKILGQDSAIDQIHQSFLQHKRCLVFHGPKGTSKYRTATALARYLNGATRYLVEVNADEFASASWENLLANSPEYYSKKATLADIVRKNPQVVLLFRCGEQQAAQLFTFLSSVLNQQGLQLQDELVDMSRVTLIWLCESEVNAQPEVSAQAATAQDDLLSLMCEPDFEVSNEKIVTVNSDMSLPLLPPDLQSLATIIEFHPITDHVIKQAIAQTVYEYSQSLLQKHHMHMQYQEEVVDYLLRQVVEQHQGEKGIELVLNTHLYPIVERHLQHLPAAINERVLTLMLNDTGQMLIGQFMR